MAAVAVLDDTAPLVMERSVEVAEKTA